MPYLPRFSPVATVIIILSGLSFLVFNILGHTYGVGGTEMRNTVFGPMDDSILWGWARDVLCIQSWSATDLAPWQYVTWMFMHVDVGHVLFNLLIFWFFASGVEERVGTWRFVGIVLVSSVGGAASFQIFGSEGVAMGLSAVVAGVAVAFALLLWRERVMVLVFMVPAWLLVVIMIVLQDIILGVMNVDKYLVGTYLTHVMHLAGAISGGIATLLLSETARDNIASLRLSRRSRLSLIRGEKSRGKRNVEQDNSAYEEELLDMILEKVSQKGMDSLSREERLFLENRSRKGK